MEKYFTSLDFPEIRGCHFLSETFWGWPRRVRWRANLTRSDSYLGSSLMACWVTWDFGCCKKNSPLQREPKTYTWSIHLEHTRNQPQMTLPKQTTYSRWWFQPLWKNISQIGSFPLGRGEHKKYLSCHHLVLVAVKGSGVCFRDKLENS